MTTTYKIIKLWKSSRQVVEEVTNKKEADETAKLLNKKCVGAYIVI